MHYALKLAGITFVRGILPLVIKLIEPAQDTAPPKPFRTVHIPHPVHQANQGGPEAANSSSSSSSGRKIRCDVYLPSKLTKSASKDPSPEHTDVAGEAEDSVISSLPVVINAHGAGFTLHQMGDDARFCQYIADTVGCVVVDVDYSKAPEAPWPQASLDLAAVIQWVRASGDESYLAGTMAAQEALKPPQADVKIRTDHIALTGFSSGGNLALVACVQAHRDGLLQHVKAVAAFYPSTNLSESAWKKPAVKPDKGASGGVMPPLVRNFFYKCYVPDDVKPEGRYDRRSPLVSPLYADAADFPQSVTIITASGDSLAREARQLAEHIVANRASQQAESEAPSGREATSKSEPPDGVPDVTRVAIPHNHDREGVLWWQAPGQGHAWDKMTKPGSQPEALKDEAYALVAERLKAAFTG